VVRGPRAAARWVRREAAMITGEWRARSVLGPAFELLARPPQGAGKAVMLIPGLLGSDERLAFLARWLRHWGYRALDSGIKHNSHCPDRLIDSLAARLKGHLEPGEKALLIGHSKGGLLSYGIAHRHPELVERVLAMGSPLRDPFGLQWNTSVTVRAVAALNRIRREARPGCYTRECSCDAMRLAYSDSALSVPVTNIASPKDGIVRFESCLHPHVVIKEVDSWHNSMPCEPQVIELVAAWLGQGPARPPALAPSS
jgi:pimeloyl-ACP methyl ester carboxylesterase